MSKWKPWWEVALPKVNPFIYRYRGYILAVMALAMLLLPFALDVRPADPFGKGEQGDAYH